MDEYTPCKKADPTAQEAIGNGMAQPCADYVIRRIEERSKAWDAGGGS